MHLCVLLAYLLITELELCGGKNNASQRTVQRSSVSSVAHNCKRKTLTLMLERNCKKKSTKKQKAAGLHQRYQFA